MANTQFSKKKIIRVDGNVYLIVYLICLKSERLSLFILPKCKFYLKLNFKVWNIDFIYDMPGKWGIPIASSRKTQFSHFILFAEIQKLNTCNKNEIPNLDAISRDVYRLLWITHLLLKYTNYHYQMKLLVMNSMIIPMPATLFFVKKVCAPQLSNSVRQTGKQRNSWQ